MRISLFASRRLIHTHKITSRELCKISREWWKLSHLQNDCWGCEREFLRTKQTFWTWTSGIRSVNNLNSKMGSNDKYQGWTRKPDDRERDQMFKEEQRKLVANVPEKSTGCFLNKLSGFNWTLHWWLKMYKRPRDHLGYLDYSKRHRRSNFLIQKDSFSFHRQIMCNQGNCESC